MLTYASLGGLCTCPQPSQGLMIGSVGSRGAFLGGEWTCCPLPGDKIGSSRATTACGLNLSCGATDVSERSMRLARKSESTGFVGAELASPMTATAMRMDEVGFILRSSKAGERERRCEQSVR